MANGRVITSRLVPSLIILLVAISTHSNLLAQTNPLPFITEPLVPTVVAPGGPGFTLTVNGSGFVSGSVVNWNGSSRVTTFVDHSQLTATILASDIATTGTASVTVQDPSPGGGTSNVAFFGIANPIANLVFASFLQNLGSGFIARPMVGADLNGDGKLDLVITWSGEGFGTSAGFDVLLANGDGTFDPSFGAATASDGYSVTGAITSGDFNGDGKTDIAVTVPQQSFSNEPTAENGTVLIFLGNGDGTFVRPPASFPIANAPLTSDSFLLAADLNGDGKLDLIVGNNVTDASGMNYLSSNVSVLLGNGDGSFQAPVAYPVAGYISGLAIGDFNQDGKLDVASATAGAGGQVLLGNGDGTFQAPANSVFQGLGLISVDVNGDGKLDLLTTGGNVTSVYLGNGDGTFQAGVGYTSGTQGASEDLALADFNADGKIDVAVGHGNGLPVAILFGNGDGTFQTPLYVPVASSQGPLVAGDFTGGGKSDLAILPNGTVFSDFILMTVLLQGAYPVANLSQLNAEFPQLFVGRSSLGDPITLQNTGSSPLIVSSVSLGPSNVMPEGVADFAQTNTCAGVTLAPNAACQITVTFSPETSGSLHAALVVSDNGIGSTQLVTLSGFGQDFSLAASSQMASVAAGQTASYALTVTPSGEFTQPVTFTCSGAPVQSTCAVSPNAIELNGSIAAVTVTVSTTGSAKIPGHPDIVNLIASRWVLTLVFLALIVGFLARGTARFRLSHALLFLLFLYCAMLGGCRAGANPPGTGTNSQGAGTPTGNYALTVTATTTSGSAALVHNIPLTLLVQ